ncbi:AmmeMemoRadiSam system protein B [Marinilabiliaceae bacterium JC017]|nr:AmmeMemoRadiSam system protein B [Marinilabiliaceae bacterium JC017]
MEKLVDREPVVAGRFYNESKPALEAQVNEFLQHAKLSKETDPIQAVIAPHAGYVFSGVVAASAFRQISQDQDFDNVFLIGSSHHEAFDGAAIYNCGNYKTPLGVVEVNIDLANEIINSCECFETHLSAHEREHTLEVQLPFIQMRLKPGYRIIPIIIGTRDPQECEKMAKALMPYFTPNNLFVVSSDFSHYPAYETAVRVDRETAEAVIQNDPEKLLEELSFHKEDEDPNLLTSLCGWTSVLTLLYMTQDSTDLKFEHLKYMNSGDVSFGDKERVVGYHAIAVRRSAESDSYLTKDEKNELLRLARMKLEALVGKGKMNNEAEHLITDKLNSPAGVFVSLHKEHQLRGCIGAFETYLPLRQMVLEMTEGAAFRDTRFNPVSADELDEIEIEISVLTPIRKVADVSEIILGHHGIHIKKEGHTGTFLPQVAVKTGWTLEEFLGHCARDKARIGWDGWQEADIYVFEAIIFSE